MHPHSGLYTDPTKGHHHNHHLAVIWVACGPTTLTACLSSRWLSWRSRSDMLTMSSRDACSLVWWGQKCRQGRTSCSDKQPMC